MTFLMILLAALVGGTNTPLVKLNVNYFSPVTVAFLRFSLAFLMISPIVLAKRLKFKAPEPDLLIANLLFAANILIFVYAIRLTSIIVAQSLYLLTAIFVAILAYFLIGEKIIKGQIVGLAIAIVGLIILIYGSIKTKDVLSFGTPAGNALTFLAVLDWSLYVVMSKKISKKYSPFTITIYNFLTTSALALIFVIVDLRHQILLLNTLTGTKVLSLLALAFFSTVAFFFLYQWVVKYTSAFLSTFVNYLATAFAAGIGVIMFGEKLTYDLLFSAALIMIGTLIAASSKQIRSFVNI